ncbi:hypothetical protein [Shewanella nanhaiensis]|uniref:Uncharacterized protein n=1 Tax=Shewanella nanhaiensis TaxID=2864872 RepID=A0ABS7E5A4_9GAMM|nr:hypothetical protein [Shewanella nanhaiensis]MBW8184774.1 hypothetical protein [Shewanella nanhaiensis]
MTEWLFPCELNAEVGSQKYSLQASFSASGAALTSLNVEQLCSSLVALPQKR